MDQFLKHIICILILILLFSDQPQSAYAQGPLQGADIWQDVDEGSLANRGQNRVIIPDKYRLVSVDIAALDNILAQAPIELTVAARNANPVLTLPMPDGAFQRFWLEEAPMMQPRLAQKLPNVRTYRGIGIDDPTAIGYFDRTPQGFHGVIYSAGDSIFIDPYQRENIVHYQSYYKGDYGNFWNKTFVETGIDLTGLHTEQSQLALHNRSNGIGEVRRTYRIAVAATGEYTQFHEGTVAGAQAAIVTTMNRVIGIYERELSISFVLIDNTNIVFTNPASDPYSNTSGDLTPNQQTIDNVIGSANYDIGHLVGTNGGGLAALGVVCLASSKARGLTGLGNPVGDPFDVDYVAHEIGHQFGGGHTFNANATGACVGNRSFYNAYEPGGGTSIQAYAGICSSQNVQNKSDDYFHARSFDQMITYVTTGPGGTCGTQVSTNNAAPIVSAGEDFAIPAQTPFTLDGSATDADGDALTYSWEEFDLGPVPASEANLPNRDTDGKARPIFRSLKPVTKTYRTFPEMGSILDGSYSNNGESLPTINRTMQFRLTARDNKGGVDTDSMHVVVASSAGPFRVTEPSGAIVWRPASQQIVTWDVANTTAAPISCSTVDITLSTDGGSTFPITLAANTPNTGNKLITVPAEITSVSAHIKVACADNIFFDVSEAELAVCSPLLNDDHEAASTTWSESYDTNQNENHWQRKMDGGGYNGSAHYWYVQNLDASSVSYLESQPITAIDGFVSLKFIHQYVLESGYDAGALEINVNNGGWTYIDNSRFIKNGYNTRVSHDVVESPLQNKEAFSGNSSRYIESIVDLQGLVNSGQMFRIRFLEANDQGFGMDGWYIDNVLVCDKPVMPSLQVTHTAPALAEPGQVILYQIQVKNIGTADQTNLHISDSLPENVVFKGPILLDPPGSGTIGLPPTLFHAVTLPAGQVMTVTVPVTVNTGISAGSMIMNTASIISDEITEAQLITAETTLLDVPPITREDIISTDEDTQVMISALANDEDRNGDTLSITHIGLPIDGSATYDVDQIVYTPDNRAATYEDVFTYTATAGGQSVSSSVHVTVSADDDPPDLINILNQSIDTATSVARIPFTIDDADTPLAALDLSASSSDPKLILPTNIVFSGNQANRTMAVTPTIGMSGVATVTVTVNDGTSSTSDTFVVAVDANSPPEFVSAPLIPATVNSKYRYDILTEDANTDLDSGEK